MKTFFAFMTGLLGGTFIGIVFISIVSLYSPEYRDLIDDISIK